MLQFEIDTGSRLLAGQATQHPLVVRWGKGDEKRHIQYASLSPSLNGLQDRVQSSATFWVFNGDISKRVVIIFEDLSNC